MLVRRSVMNEFILFLFLLSGFLRQVFAKQNCQEANAQCLYHEGCRHAVQRFHSSCADIISGRRRRCTVPCRDATIVLLAGSGEGQSLWDCQCDVDGCEEIRERVEVCRSSVVREMKNDSATPWKCGPAYAFCEADPVCAQALHYYFINCRALIRGQRCSFRCRNSISILSRQKPSLHLQTCVCDGTEDFPCAKVKQQMQLLCHKRRKKIHHTVVHPVSVSIVTLPLDAVTKASGVSAAVATTTAQCTRSGGSAKVRVEFFLMAFFPLLCRIA